jgi:hypothetical protein
MNKAGSILKLNILNRQHIRAVNLLKQIKAKATTS